MNTKNYCDICGEQIFSDEARYELPDGKVICADPDCLSEWAADYERVGSRW